MATEMDFVGNWEIRNISSLSGLSKLKKLYLNCTGITSLSALNNLNLSQLYIYSTGVSAEEIKQYAADHPYCRVFSDYGSFNQMPAILLCPYDERRMMLK